ncbi:MAG: hypothetical protein Q9168_006041 [Polycauliona sp. 1 TL-2023]
MSRTPFFSPDVRSFVKDWKTPGTSRMLKYDLLGPETSTFKTSLAKFLLPTHVTPSSVATVCLIPMIGISLQSPSLFMGIFLHGERAKSFRGGGLK